MVLTALGNVRETLAEALGHTSHKGARQYYKVLGYPKDIETDQYLGRYHRQDIAGRIVDLPATDTWKLPPIIKVKDSEEGPFNDALSILVKQRRLWSAITRADRISGIGRFGGLFLGYLDGKEPHEPAEKGSLKKPEQLIFIRPFSEANAGIKTYEKDTQSERFGQPVLYNLKVEDGEQLEVHWTRILHLADNKIDSEVFGTPRLQRIFNRLDDLVKLVGGVAEAIWLNMRPGTVMTTQPGYAMDMSDDDVKATVTKQIEEYVHDVWRFLTLEGIDVKQLTAQMLDPTGPFEVQIALISAATGIPQRVLLGSAAGELAAAEEDTKQWYGTIQSRQTNYAEPDILLPLLDRLTWVGVLPEVPEEDLAIEWPPLFEESEADRAEVAKTWGVAVRTMDTEVTDKEKRDLLGLPVEIPEDMQDDEPEEDEEPAVVIPTDDELGDEDADAEAMVAQIARENYEAGLVSLEDYRALLDGLRDDLDFDGDEIDEFVLE